MGCQSPLLTITRRVERSVISLADTRFRLLSPHVIRSLALICGRA